MKCAGMTASRQAANPSSPATQEAHMCCVCATSPPPRDKTHLLWFIVMQGIRRCLSCCQWVNRVSPVKLDAC